MPDPGRGNRTLAQLLAALHEHFSTTARLDRRASLFCVGHEAGMRFARICVLDTLASEVGHTDASIPRGRSDGRRERANLQAIGDRLTSALSTAPKRDPEYDAGYRTGVELALRYLALAHSTLDLEAAAVDGTSNPKTKGPLTTSC
ncbi:hypothetical protein DFR67_12033 [Williamsia limnetica]|uniref:Uncharacterized protein n=1 Tax=Williamsia limnetica TaxID=882452 RepID=A0A318REY2_WILLI|nr:hypothetical protein [Williamsia limnetica]PYE12754.1 hypothetical protein DFR67_12033 [Williamsia limnetica]